MEGLGKEDPNPASKGRVEDTGLASRLDDQTSHTPPPLELLLILVAKLRPQEP